MKSWLKIHPADTVAVALVSLPAGTAVSLGLRLREAIPQGHKFALADIPAGEPVRGYMNKMLFNEILPILDVDGAEEFAASVQDRFNNPFIDHKLLDISLNFTSKWRTRNLPSLLEHVEKFQRLPVCLTASFAFYIAFYREREHLIRDDKAVREFFADHSSDSEQELVHQLMKRADFWGQDLTAIPVMEAAVGELLAEIEERGVYSVMARCAGR